MLYKLLLPIQLLIAFVENAAIFVGLFLIEKIICSTNILENLNDRLKLEPIRLSLGVFKNYLL